MRVVPILFNTDMVQAILDGRKTVTRRIVKQSVWENFVCEGGNVVNWHNEEINTLEIPTYKVPYHLGNILYVRETWSEWTDGYVYRAWTLPFPQPGRYPDKMMKWRPSIHMPKDAARIWLKVTDVRVERLQDISLEDCVREGIEASRTGIFARFSILWDSTIKKQFIAKYGWDANPWVWVIEFERCDKPETR